MRTAANGGSRSRASAGTILDAFRDAAAQAGIRRSPDFNCGDNEGSATSTSTSGAAGAGRRRAASCGRSCSRPNLRLESGCLVERVQFDGTRAVGVDWRQDGALRSARCRGEVILSAGSIGSVQCCCCRASGPAAHLRSSAFRSCAPMPGVGENLQDHLQLRMIYKVSGVETLNETYGSMFGRGQDGRSPMRSFGAGR